MNKILKYIEERETLPKRAAPKFGANLRKVERIPAFWKYCQRASTAARYRAEQKRIPFEIDAYFIDELLVDQNWRCAISKEALVPGSSTFGPSLDRIKPELGYIPGNVRVVCNMLNTLKFGSYLARLNYDAAP